MKISEWWPEWYGLTDEQIAKPGDLCTEYERYQYLRFLVTRIESDSGHGSPWDYSKNMKIISAAKKHWNRDNYWEWPGWIKQEQIELMAFILGHIDLLHSQGPAARAL